MHPLVPLCGTVLKLSNCANSSHVGKILTKRKRRIVFLSPGKSNERKLHLRIKLTQLSEWKNLKLASGMVFLIGTGGIKVAFYMLDYTAGGEFVT
jgi:hypothetical protein